MERATVPAGQSPIQLQVARDCNVVLALGSGSAEQSLGRMVALLDGATGNVEATIDVGPSPWTAVAQGTRAYISMHSQPPSECLDAVQVIDVLEKRLVATIPLPPDSRARSLVPDFVRQRLYSMNWGSGTVTEIETATLSPIRSVAVGAGPHFGLVWDDTLFVANEQSNDVALVDKQTLSVVSRVPVGRRPLRVVAHRGHGEVWANNVEDDTVSVLDAHTGALVATVPVGHQPIRLTPWDRRGPDEWAVLNRGSNDGPSGSITFLDGRTHAVTKTVELPGVATNWNWGLGAHHQEVYVSLEAEPLLVVLDARRAEIVDTVALSAAPEPAGNFMNIVITPNRLFIANATRDADGEGSVTMVAPGL